MTSRPDLACGRIRTWPVAAYVHDQLHGSDTDLACGRIRYERIVGWVAITLVVPRDASVAFVVSVAVAVAGVVDGPWPHSTVRAQFAR